MKDMILSLSNLSFCGEILLLGNKKWAHDFYKGFFGGESPNFAIFQKKKG
jgi:hypothetical protein